VEDISELRELLSHKTLSAKEISDRANAENREMTDDEISDSDKLLAEAETIRDKIERRKKNDAQQQKINDAAESIRRPGTRQAAPSEPATGPRSSNEIVVPCRRVGSLQAFKGPKADENAYISGMWAIATLFPDSHPMKGKAKTFCREHGVFQGIQNAMSEGVPSAGGNLVPESMGQTIIDLRETYGIFRQWADVTQMPSDVHTIPRRSGSPSATFYGEGEAMTSSDASFNNVKLMAKKLGILTRVSSELNDDSIVSMADYLTRDIAWAFALKEDQCGFNGDGTSTYGGITGLTVKVQTNTASFPVVPTATHNTFAELDATDLITLMSKVPAYARAGSAWFISQEGADLAFSRLMAAGGGNTNQTLAIAGITALGQRGVVGTYLGYPVVVSQVLPLESTTKTNLPMLCFGNLRLAATVGDRRSINFAIDGSRYFDQDQIAIRGTERIDINVHDTGDTSTPGPCCVLKGGSS